MTRKPSAPEYVRQAVALMTHVRRLLAEKKVAALFKKHGYSLPREATAFIRSELENFLRSIGEEPRLDDESLESVAGVTAKRMGLLQSALSDTVVELEDSNTERASIQGQLDRALQYIMSDDIRAYILWGDEDTPMPNPASMVEAFVQKRMTRLLQENEPLLLQENETLRLIIHAATGAVKPPAALWVFESKYLAFQPTKENADHAELTLHLPDWKGIVDRNKLFNAKRLIVTITLAEEEDADKGGQCTAAEDKESVG